MLRKSKNSIGGLVWKSIGPNSSKKRNPNGGLFGNDLCINAETT
jgi:hypothetical protein